MEGLLEEARHIFNVMIDFNPYQQKLVEAKLNALIALFQYTGLTDGNLDKTIPVEHFHDPDHKITKAIILIYSLETFIPHSISQAIRDRDTTKVETLGPYTIALRSIILGAETGKDDSIQSKDFETILWRPAMMHQRDIYDYQQILQYRQDKAMIKNMGFVSSFENQNNALKHLIQKFKELQSYKRQAKDPNQKSTTHDSLIQDAVGNTGSWLKAPDREQKVPTLFKLEMKQEMDFFKMDKWHYSPYHEKEQEVLI